MGQKIHPNNYRLGVLYGWKSKWFAAKRNYRDALRQDTSIRRFVVKKLADARIEKVEIERSGKSNDIVISIHTAKPGMVIGRGGAGIETLKQQVEKEVLKNSAKVSINIHEVRNPSQSAGVVAQNIASDISRRIPFRRAGKQALDQIQKSGAKGAKIRIAGRLNGADIARSESFSWGSVPLHTLRADIDFAQVGAPTTYGMIGVSVWIYKGEVFDREPKEQKTESKDVLDALQRISKKRGKA